MTAHSCSFCPYTTTRVFNLSRHIASRHKSEISKIASNEPKSASKQPKSASKQPKIASKQPKIASLEPKNASHDDEPCDFIVPTCEKCNKTFSRKYYLKVHEESCDGTRKGCCKSCKQFFSNRSALDRHKKVCKTLILCDTNTDSSEDKVVPNITIVNNYNIVNNNTTNNTNNTVNLLSFPEDDDSNFDLITKHITQSIMKKCVTASKPQLGFKKFMGAVLDNLENQFVKKTNANIGYSSVHTGDGKWELMADNHVYPIITHHMTTAALAKLEEFKRSMRFMCDNFHTLVDSVNTDDECPEYQAAIYDLKLLVVNMTKQIEAIERRNAEK